MGGIRFIMGVDKDTPTRPQMFSHTSAQTQLILEFQYYTEDLKKFSSSWFDIPQACDSLSRKMLGVIIPKPH